MDWNTRIREALTATWGELDDDVVEELVQHAQATYDAARADGCTDHEAAARVAEHVRIWQHSGAALRGPARRPPAVDPPMPGRSFPTRMRRFAGLAADVRYAARLLKRQPRHAVLAMLTMALGIGATTILFSVTYGVLMRPLPWTSAERLVMLQETRGGNRPRFSAFSNVAYMAWRDQPATIDGLAAWTTRPATLAGAGEAERVVLVAATASLFPLLEARPLAGSFFSDDDATANVVVLSEGLWRQRFGGDESAINRIVQLDGLAHRIIGVLPDGAAFPNRQARLWVPFRVPDITTNSLSLFGAVARLRPGVTPTQAAAEATTRSRAAPDGGLTATAIFGSRGPIAVSATPMQEAITADVRQPLLVLLIAVGLLLATATANVASLQLAHATTRHRELAIRTAVGADHGRVTRQLLVESLLLGGSGGAAGLAVAWALHRAMPALLPADFPRANELTIDSTVVVFTALVTVAASMAFGIAPALRARRLNLVESLTDDGTAVIGARPGARGVRVVIMGAQVAMACVLLIGASLLGQSFIALVDADRGYEPAGVLTARLSLPAAMYQPERRHDLVAGLLVDLAADPGVERAAFTSELPLTPGGSTAAFTMRSPSADGGTISVQASPRVVSQDYFPAIGLRIVAGRAFTDDDTDGAPGVVVVNQSFARRYLGNDPIGARLPVGVGYHDPAEGTVIGVVEDVRYVAPAAPTLPEMYYSFSQMRGRLAVPGVTLVLRTSRPPSALVPMLRTRVRNADRGLVPDLVAPLEERMLTNLARPRLYATLLITFAVFALMIVTVGVFGVLSSFVAQRSREIAVRAALGARQADLLRLVIRQGLTMTAGGVAAGVIGSFALMRALAGLLYGVTPYDTLTYVAVPLIVAAAGLLACAAPAIRAARVDPLLTLRG
jgi:putative ABC transport system permease protein